jgi:hypothetical protein
MLAQADLADVIMAPAADMFELGVKVQVLKRGTMFGVRAAKLYDAYVAHPSLAAIPPEARARLENDVLHATFEEIWADTKTFWQKRDPGEIARCEADPRRQMALVFRWYLGKASKWAIDGEPTRRADYQIWCGPAMGAFNAWARGSFLAEPGNRTVVQIGLNLLEGAAVITRAQQLRTYGPNMIHPTVEAHHEDLVQARIPHAMPASRQPMAPYPWPAAPRQFVAAGQPQAREFRTFENLNLGQPSRVRPARLHLDLTEDPLSYDQVRSQALGR